MALADAPALVGGLVIDLNVVDRLHNHLIRDEADVLVNQTVFNRENAERARCGVETVLLVAVADVGVSNSDLKIPGATLAGRETFGETEVLAGSNADATSDEILQIVERALETIVQTIAVAIPGLS